MVITAGMCIAESETKHKNRKVKFEVIRNLYEELEVEAVY